MAAAVVLSNRQQQQQLPQNGGFHGNRQGRTLRLVSKQNMGSRSSSAAAEPRVHMDLLRSASRAGSSASDHANSCATAGSGCGFHLSYSSSAK